MSSTPAPATVDPQAEFVVRHYGETYGLPVVILSTRTAHGRGLSRARELPVLAAPAVPQSVDPVPPGFVRIAGPIPVCTDCYSRPRIPDPIAEAARRAPAGSRFLVFVGRLFPGAVEAVAEHTRPIIDVQATEGAVAMAITTKAALVALLRKAQTAVRRIDDAKEPVSEKELEVDDAIVEALKACDAIVMDAPALKGDTEELSSNVKIERRIVWNLIDKLAAAGFLVVGVDDGEDKPVKCADAMAAMEAVFAVDDCRLLIKKPGTRGSSHAILLVGGNGEDVISDWNYTTGDPDGFNAFMEGFKPGENW